VSNEIIINNGQKTYHSPNCPHIKSIIKTNKIDCASALDAFTKGNKPCHVCKPPLPSFSCPSCGDPVIPREDRHGFFYGCSQYPLDTYVISWELAAEKLVSGELSLVSREPIMENSLKVPLESKSNEELLLVATNSDGTYKKDAIQAATSIIRSRYGCALSMTQICEKEMGNDSSNNDDESRTRKVLTRENIKKVDVNTQKREIDGGDITLGIVFIIGGVVITLLTYSAHSSYYLLALGPILFGIFRVIRGLIG
jgi:hypothetical protein